MSTTKEVIKINPKDYLKEAVLTHCPFVRNYMGDLNYVVGKLLERGLDSEIHFNVLSAWLCTKPSLFDVKKRLNRMEGQLKKNDYYKHPKSIELMKNYYDGINENNVFFYSPFWGELSTLDDILPSI